MAGKSLEPLRQLIRPGEPVTAGVTNRPLQVLGQDVNYLWEVLQDAAYGSTVFIRRATVEAAAVPGMAVYFNATRARFERGLAQLDTSPAVGVLQTADSARVWGIVTAKHNDTLADILLFGYFPVDLTGAVLGGNVPAGVYYLSGTTPGMLTAQKPPVSVPVLRADGAGNVFVQPQFVDFLDRHTHYRFPLVCRPAGHVSAPTPGEHHVISAADGDSPGWLPADHSSFEGRAPAGAKFGYNLNADPVLKNAWPPLPVDSVTLTWDRGLEKEVGGTAVPLGPTGVCIVNRDGLWWLSNCYGDVPWPTGYDNTPVSASWSESINDNCPRHLAMEMLLWFTKVDFATDATVVKSLRSGDSRIIVRCINGAPASTGDLELLLDLNLVVSNDARGYLALKDLVGTTLTRGPVVEGLYANSDNVVLTGDATSKVNPLDASSATMYHGRIGITVAPETSLEVPARLIRLDGATEEYEFNTPYLGFAAAEQQAMRAVFDIPATLSIPEPQFQLRLRILGRALGTLPQLTVTGRRVLQPADGDTADLPTDGDEFAITIDTSVALASGNEYVEVVSEPFDVAAGDTLYLTVQRAYNAELGILRHVGVITSGVS
jgi:hypothetical protein